jgi:hypothetical protein
MKIVRMPVSPADRKVSSKSTSNCRVTLYNPYGTGPLYCESLFEAYAAIIIMARNDVVDMSCQYQVRFGDGDNGVHNFDIMVRYKNGLVKLFAVRPSNYVDEELLATIEDIRNYVLNQHADECEILTESVITQANVYRAGEILRARSLLNAENCRRMMRTMAGMPGIYQVYELLESFGDFASGWTAMWNLIDRGMLKHDCENPDNMRLTHASWLKCA